MITKKAKEMLLEYIVAQHDHHAEDELTLMSHCVDGDKPYVNSLELEKFVKELPVFDFDQVSRIEVIDHTKGEESGRAYTYWNEYDKKDVPNPQVDIQLQDNNRTLKVFIKS